MSVENTCRDPFKCAVLCDSCGLLIDWPGNERPSSLSMRGAGSSRNGWKPVLTEDLALAAVRAARDVAARHRAAERVESAAAAARAQTAFPRSTHWIPYAISQGYAGLAVLWGYLDSCFGDEGWDVTGREHLELAVRASEMAQDLPVGLFSGLSGLAFGAWQLSRQGLRYRR